VPLPAVVRRETGALSLARGLAISGGGEEGKTLGEALKADGIRVGKGGARVTLKTAPGLPPEGYRLRVGPDGATLEATTAAGLYYAGQTLRQLAAMKEIPAVAIEDAPRFRWRGMMLDVSRHFRTVADVERIVDLNARMKLNTFHWHLTDDGGWRMETKAYPALTARGAWRTTPQKDWGGPILFPASRTGGEYGGFYTQDEIKAVVAYAARRHVTVVPEIEMPGHAIAALQSLPWLGCDDPKGRAPTAVCPGKETTFAFLQKALDETMALFPSRFIHVGGDEVDKTIWQDCPRCQERMKTEGLKNVEELQSYLIRRMDAYLASKGRRLVGWDEILEGGLAPGATVMSWRGVGGGIAAAKAGRDVVMSPTSHLYLDYSYDTIPTATVYGYDPIPAELSPVEAKRVLGAQGNVWTEWLPEERDVERMAYPRAAALAEAVWTPLDRKSWPDFSARLEGVRPTWDRLGVAYRIDAPAVGRTTSLSDEPVFFDLPAAPAGWELRVGDPAKPVAFPDGKPLSNVGLPLGADVPVYFVRRSDGAISPETRLRVGKGDRRPNVDGLMPGLNVLSAVGRFDVVPDMTSWGPVGTATAIDLSKKPADERFAMGFRGFIRFPKDGEYAFTLRSDDGSLLRIGGLIVVDHDGAHASTAKTGTLWAKAGVYPFEVGYFDAGGASSLSLAMKTPDGAAGPVPTDWLWRSQ